MANGSSTVSSAKDMAEAAKVWLGRLGKEQRAKATFPFETAERLNWNFIPMTRQGLSRGEMDGAALEAADALMSTGLSTNAYERARQIIDHELILGEIEARSGGSGFHRRPELYFHTVFGEPGEGPWGWRVDGHHLSLNFTIVDGEVAGSTPCFLGANPAEVFHGPHKGLRIMRQEEDLARELFVSLDSDLRSIATIYPVAPSEIIMRASDRVTIGSPAGVAAGALPADSRDRLMALVKLYVDRHEGGLAASSMREIEAAGVEDIHFGWAGGDRRREPHYYRIHGPRFFVEYDNTQDNANHVHSVWRDIDSDFGYDALGAHYEAAHQG